MCQCKEKARGYCRPSLVFLAKKNRSLQFYLIIGNNISQYWFQLLGA